MCNGEYCTCTLFWLSRNGELTQCARMADLLLDQAQPGDEIWQTPKDTPCLSKESFASRVDTVLKDRFGLTINWDKK